MVSQPEVTFIICTYNRAEYLDDTIKSILRYDHSDLNFELLIIDNNSQDQTGEVVQKYQKAQDDKPIRYIKEPKQGLSYARNKGIKEALATYIVFLDDDIRAAKSLIPAWMSFFSKYPNAIAAGGKIHVQFDAARPEWMSHFLLPLLGHHDLGNSLKKYPKNKYPFGGNMGFKKSIFDKTGLFDVELGRKGKSLSAGEEKELFRRLRSQNKDIYYLPKAFLYHRVDAGRLTVDYIRKQALGLGQSMAIQLEQTAFKSKLKKFASELFKAAATFILFIFYSLCFQYSKAKMVIKFRYWVWKGYLSFK